MKANVAVTYLEHNGQSMIKPPQFQTVHEVEADSISEAYRIALSKYNSDPSRIVIHSEFRGWK